MKHHKTRGQYQGSVVEYSLTQTLVVALLVTAGVVGNVMVVAASGLALAFLAGAATAAVVHSKQAGSTTVTTVPSHRFATSS